MTPDRYSPDNAERIARYQTNYVSILAGHGYEPSQDRADFLKLMEGKEYGEGPLLSAWSWFREGRSLRPEAQFGYLHHDGGQVTPGWWVKVGGEPPPQRESP